MTSDDEELKSLASQPKAAEVDGQRMEMHSLKDQIELDRYLASKKAVRANRLGIRIGRMAAGGAI